MFTRLMVLGAWLQLTACTVTPPSDAEQDCDVFQVIAQHQEELEGLAWGESLDESKTFDIARAASCSGFQQGPKIERMELYLEAARSSQRHARAMAAEGRPMAAAELALDMWQYSLRQAAAWGHMSVYVESRLGEAALDIMEEHWASLTPHQQDHLTARLRHTLELDVTPRQLFESDLRALPHLLAEEPTGIFVVIPRVWELYTAHREALQADSAEELLATLPDSGELTYLLDEMWSKRQANRQRAKQLTMGS